MIDVTAGRDAVDALWDRASHAEAQRNPLAPRDTVSFVVARPGEGRIGDRFRLTWPELGVRGAEMVVTWRRDIRVPGFAGTLIVSSPVPS